MKPSILAWIAAGIALAVPLAQAQTNAPDGTLRAPRIQVSKDGVKPPQ